jgi:hypothetical protein
MCSSQGEPPPVPGPSLWDSHRENRRRAYPHTPGSAWFTPGNPSGLRDLHRLPPDMVEIYQMGWEDAMRAVEAGSMGVGDHYSKSYS